MPREASSSPPILDPFPPLRLADHRPHRPLAPTYASVARVEAASEPRWGAEDVERQEGLDDINLYHALPPQHAPSPPWRQAPLRGAPERATVVAVPFRSRGENSPRVAVTTPEVEGTTVAEAGPSRSQPRSLAPIFTLDELLGAARPNASANGDSGPVSLPAQQRQRRLRNENFTQGDPGWTVWDAIRDDRSAEPRAWEGGIAAARRQGYGTANNVTENGTTIVGSLMETLENNQQNPSGTLRRRRRMFQAHRLGSALESLDAGMPRSQGLEDMFDQDFSSDDDDEEWSGRWPTMPTDWRRIARGQATEAQATGPAGSGASLLRGGNNRRRRSLLERVEAGESSVHLPMEVNTEMVRESSGMEPTNTGGGGGQVPLIVRSRGIRRLRGESEDEGEPRSESATPKAKRRKVDFIEVQSPPLSRPTYLDYSTLLPSTSLPDSFEPPAHNSHLSLRYLRSANGARRSVISFTLHPMPTRTDADASALRANRPIPVGCGVHYYEIEVLDQGEEGFMSVGWMLKGLCLGRLVGWDKGSWGWHADDGRSFEGQGKGEEFSEKWGTGDVVGCGVDFTTGRAFFTKNGKLMGHRFSKMGKGLYPAVGLRTPRESIAINFTGPFVFDIDKYARDVRDRIWSSATRAAIPEVVLLVDQIPEADKPVCPASSPDDATKSEGENSWPRPATAELPLRSSMLIDPEQRTIGAFVLDYLQHHGHGKALSSVRSEMSRRGWVTAPSVSESYIKATPSPGPFPVFSLLRDIRYLSSHGLPIPEEPRYSKVIESLRQPSNSDQAETLALWRRLRISQFVRQLEYAADDEMSNVLEGGRALLAESKTSMWSPAEVDRLADAFGLLGTPAERWTLEVRDTWRRRALKDAEDTDRHLRRVFGLKPRTHLEQAVAQTRLVGKALVENGVGDGAFIDVRRVWEDTTTREEIPESREKRAGDDKMVDSVAKME